jgi:hypothetical protein
MSLSMARKALSYWKKKRQDSFGLRVVYARVKSKSGTKSETTDGRIDSELLLLFRVEGGRRRQRTQINGSELTLLSSVSFETFVACVQEAFPKSCSA